MSNLKSSVSLDRLLLDRLQLDRKTEQSIAWFIHWQLNDYHNVLIWLIVD